MGKVIRIPLRRAAQIEALDKEDVIEGYFDGTKNSAEPGDDKSFSYWHGWANGMVDGGHRKINDAQSELAEDIRRACEAGNNPFAKIANKERA